MKNTKLHDERYQAALTGFDALPDSAYVRLPVVAALTGASRPTVWRWSKTGHLPAPKKIGRQVTGWQVGALRRCPALASEGAAA